MRLVDDVFSLGRRENPVSENNLVQVEFFADVRKVAVIRFYDPNSYLTKHAAIYAHYEKVRAGAIDDCNKAPNRVLKWFVERAAARALSSREKTKQRARLAATKMLREAAQGGQEVAIENSDHSFRIAKQEEILGTLEAAKRAESAWIFLFKPTTLCADDLEGVGYIM
jgi:hypothetical protein